MRMVIFFALLITLLRAECSSERFDINIKEPIQLKSALYSIMQECGYSLSVEGKETQKIFNQAKISFTQLKGVKADEAIRILMNRSNLHYSLQSDLIVVKYIDTRLFKIDFINNTRESTSSSDIKIGGSTTGGSSETKDSSGSSTGSSSSIIKTKEQFDFWGTLQDEIYSILNRPEDDDVEIKKESIVVNPRSGVVAISGTFRQIERVSKYLERTLRSLRKQVMIDVQIIAVDSDGKKATGIDWHKFPLFTITGQGVGNYGDSSVSGVSSGYTFTGKTDEISFKLDAFLNFLKTQGTTKALSNPKVLAMNNQPTLISVGDTINFLIKTSTVLSGGGSGSASESTEPQELFVGVLLDITPQIDDDGYITLRINPSISELKYVEDNLRQDKPREVAPDTINRRISSVVRAKDRDVIVLGGLISNLNRVEESKLPLLGDIPFFGNLFRATRKSNTQRELVFVLTPHIIDDDNSVVLQDLGYQGDTEKLLKPNLRYNVPKIKEMNG